ncbi:hypothetical protein QJS10_CPB11g00806 [Acorus calamus]|uniref:PTEN2A/B C2 domain-containing protein n=1 Tax=Acorus calamus TaxID=4465 RepID=A0AAV9DW16_ACOCL|nr:hypothetical protein QJS10_CPB11g00806 [Acorus calamus]
MAGLSDNVTGYIHFHDRQGEFYCWLNTTMMENRKVLTTSDLDGFDKRKLPSLGFQVEVVLVDYNGSLPPRQTSTTDGTESSNASSVAGSTTSNSTVPPPNPIKEPVSNEKDDVFSDSESEETASSKVDSMGLGTVSEFKAIVADASLFTYGDEDDYESE